MESRGKFYLNNIKLDIIGCRNMRGTQWCHLFSDPSLCHRDIRQRHKMGWTLLLLKNENEKTQSNFELQGNLFGVEEQDMEWEALESMH
jgi:hypothetical protein